MAGTNKNQDSSRQDPAQDLALLDCIERFRDTPVLVMGDLILDHYVWGKVNRISPEAPVVVVQVTEESKRAGGAGNVAANLLSLGARVSVCGIVGDDDNGRLMVDTLKSQGADINSIMVDRSRPTTVKTRVIAHAQQVVRVDREVVSPISETYSEGLAASVQSRLNTLKGVIISDYGKGTITRSIFDRLQKGESKTQLGLGKVPLLVDPKAPNFSMYVGSTVIKPNRREAEEASGLAITDRASAIRAGNELLKKWNCEMVLITLGEDGMILVSADKSSGKPIEIDTVAREVYDVSGAGDTVSAVFTLALASGATPEQAARLSNYAAGIVVREVGTVAVSRDELCEVVKEGLEG